MLLKENLKNIQNSRNAMLTDPQHKLDSYKNQRGSQLLFLCSFISNTKFAKVKSPLMWTFPTVAFLKACSCGRSSIPLLNKTVKIRKLWLFRHSGQAHKRPYQKLASPCTNMLFTQSPIKVRAAPERQRILVFPMSTVVNAVCDFKTSPLDGNMIQQLKKI